MAKQIASKHMIDLTNAGSFSIIDTTGIDVLSITTPMAGLMGNAIVELNKFVGGIAVPYSPAAVLNSATSSIIKADVDGIDQAALIVVTADSSVADLTANAYGEETQ